ncbi:phosphotransferase [Kitasatospora sp. NPDC101447]|uniref:phosphotransferase n=1 Tax=Kitasatospora sp. NPDC101447 TaxID=3364102 RepID=UPI00381CD118
MSGGLRGQPDRPGRRHHLCRPTGRARPPDAGSARRGQPVAARRHLCVAGTPVISTALTAAEERELYRQAERLLAALHTQPTTGAPVGEYLPWGQERARALARARDARLADEDIEVLAEATRAEPPPTALAYCHGDFDPRN